MTLTWLKLTHFSLTYTVRELQYHHQRKLCQSPILKNTKAHFGKHKKFMEELLKAQNPCFDKNLASNWNFGILIKSSVHHRRKVVQLGIGNYFLPKIHKIFCCQYIQSHNVVPVKVHLELIKIFSRIKLKVYIYPPPLLNLWTNAVTPLFVLSINWDSYSE